MNKKPLFAVGVVLSMTLAVGGAVILAGRPSPACAANAVVSFNDDILPIFKGRCVDCHQSGGVGYEKSGLDLRTYAGVMKGTKFGSMVTPGNPDTSNLVWLLGLEGFARNCGCRMERRSFQSATEMRSANGFVREPKTISPLYSRHSGFSGLFAISTPRAS